LSELDDDELELVDFSVDDFAAGLSEDLSDDDELEDSLLLLEPLMVLLDESRLSLR
jgi:hypothetical protein